MRGVRCGVIGVVGNGVGFVCVRVGGRVVSLL